MNTIQRIEAMRVAVSIRGARLRTNVDNWHRVVREHEQLSLANQGRFAEDGEWSARRMRAHALLDLNANHDLLASLNSTLHTIALREQSHLAR